MAHKFEHAQALLTALDFPRQSAGILFPLENNPQPVALSYEETAKSTYEILNDLGQLLAPKIPNLASGNRFDTRKYYNDPGSEMMVLTLKPADNTTIPEAISESIMRADTILDMYAAVNLTTEDLVRAVVEKRPAPNGYIVEVLIKSHGTTPRVITDTVKGVTPIIGHLADLNDEYTTLKLTQLEIESGEAFINRINQALETTMAGIISHSQSSLRRTRQELIAA